MLTEYGQSLEGGPESPEAVNLITAILPHPFHGRLVEFPLLMVNKQISVEGVRYDLVWRDGALAFYRPITTH
jgi:hypothetical protein